jgi:hypothetical protein
MAFRSSIDRPVRMKQATGVLILLAALGSSPVAHAGPREDADAALHRGVVLRREGKDAEALDAFQRALSLAPSARARAQVALAEQALALWIAAERDLALALSERDDAWIKQNREPLEGAARVVASKLAWAVVDVKAPHPEIFVNGSPTPTGADGRVRVVAGVVTIEVRAEGYDPASTSLRIPPETTATISLELEPTMRRRDSSSPPPGPPRESSTGSQRTTGWILTGVGAVGIGIGTAFGLRAMSKKDERDSDCVGGCSRVGVDADRAGRSAALVSTIAMLGGVAVAGAGVWFILRAPSSSPASIGVQTNGSSIHLSGSF